MKEPQKIMWRYFVGYWIKQREAERQLKRKIEADREEAEHCMLFESWYEELHLQFPAMSDEMGDIDEQLASWMSMR